MEIPRKSSRSCFTASSIPRLFATNDGKSRITFVNRIKDFLRIAHLREWPLGETKLPQSNVWYPTFSSALIYSILVWVGTNHSKPCIASRGHSIILISILTSTKNSFVYCCVLRLKHRRVHAYYISLCSYYITGCLLFVSKVPFLQRLKEKQRK